jgi:two-component system chemotaxis response regulator CheB
MEMVINVGKASEAENKLHRDILNVLIIDLDTVISDMISVRLMQSRFKLLAIYTSSFNSRAQFVVRNNNTDFILKPAVLSSVAGVQLANAFYRRAEGFLLQQLPPGTRDLAKMVTVEHSNKKIIAIASSTGGTTAIETIMKKLPADIPPVVMVQHMPSGFTKLFADRLNATFKQEILEAKTGDYLQTGRVLLAPADRHMKLVRQQGKFAVECYIGTKMHGVMPAADILFDSVAELAKANAVGVILTGMGADGARGLKQMHSAGAKTIGQNAESCVVYGMPKVARDLGAVEYELHLDKIAEKIMELI